MPASVCGRLQRRLDLNPKNVALEFEQARERFIGHWGTAMFLLVPMFALWLKLAWLNRHMRDTEHLAFALHLHAFWFAAILLTQLQQALLSAGAMFAMPVYAVLASHRVHGGRWWSTPLRNAAVATAYGLVLAVALGVVALWAILG